jgi:predicted nucleotidyltransferase
MRIKPDECVLGFSARQMRELLRQSNLRLSFRDVTRVLGLKGKKALQFLETLEKQGYIEKNTDIPDSETHWKHTIRGGALCNALFSAPVSRRNAEKKLAEFMERVHRVNKNKRFLYKVQKVLVFGSFLTESPTVGDLDIAIDLQPKEPDSKKHTKLIRARADEALQNGRHFRNYVESLQYAYQEVRSVLKARSRILQLTDCDDGVLTFAKYRVVYEHPGVKTKHPEDAKRKERPKRTVRQEKLNKPPDTPF